MIPATWKTGLAAGAAVALAFGAWWVHARFTDLQEQLQVAESQRDQARVGSLLCQSTLSAIDVQAKAAESAVRLETLTWRNDYTAIKAAPVVQPPANVQSAQQLMDWFADELAPPVARGQQ